ncbi:jg4578 [Pararge aegeria aegeria]|uniref:Jg4578 protein n=1 Tax=Pararge aegeria aegeria TaxID=348720 RepID=A0A8S4RNL8_9NEOP|nr:jg4578 [Pararge aegeria aegeria]
MTYSIANNIINIALLQGLTLKGKVPKIIQRFQNKELRNIVNASRIRNVIPYYRPHKKAQKHSAGDGWREQCWDCLCVIRNEEIRRRTRVTDT